ncbi:unnamed protein product [Peronospora belbahrii]|uniref:Uncharacterized protein n=1 Tax=Peronospora belbahrii TaxID=622444 RepID=A0AAU9L7N6_9STRA|nr:unnamed protein product [Peronospora belbahrii]
MGSYILALERALQCCRGVVIFEVILSIQRLIKKYGATHQPASDGQSAASSSTVPVKTALHSGDSSHDASETSSSSNSCTSGYRDKRCLVMEWDIILRMLRALRPWVSMTDEKEMEKFPQQSLHPDDRRPEADVNRHTRVHPNNDLLDQS